MGRAPRQLRPIAAKGGRAVNFPGRRRPRMPRTMIAAARAAAEDIAALDNVHYVAIGEKHVAGSPTGTIALIAYVSRKEDMAPAQRIPAHVALRFGNGRCRDVPTDVVELACAPRTLGMRAGNVIRAADNDLGMCGFTFQSGGQNYALTNAHVVANMATNNFPGEPGVIDPGTQLTRPLGKTLYVSNFLPGTVTSEDVALIHVTQVPVDAHFLVGEQAPVAAFGDFANLMGGQFWYNINGVRIQLDSPQPVLNQKVQIQVDGAVFYYTGFWALRIVKGVIAPGHSGSLVCSGNGNQIDAYGMLFGGAPPSYAYVFPINDVRARVQAHLPPVG